MPQPKSQKVEITSACQVIPFGDTIAVSTKVGQVIEVDFQDGEYLKATNKAQAPEKKEPKPTK